MNHNKIGGIKKQRILKLFMFLVVLIVSLISFYEKQMIVDALYFIIVLLLFIKFLIVKLYR